MNEKIKDCLHLLSLQSSGFKIYELRQLLNLENKDMNQLLNYLAKLNYIESNYGDRYKITLDGRLYLDSILDAKNNITDLNKGLTNNRNNTSVNNDETKKNGKTKIKTALMKVGLWSISIISGSILEKIFWYIVISIFSIVSAIIAYIKLK